MNQQPDKFFRDKLENFTRPVSANAWSRVEGQLDKKNTKAWWLKIAASLLMVAVAGFILIKISEPHTSDKLTTNTKTVAPDSSAKKEKQTNIPTSHDLIPNDQKSTAVNAPSQARVELKSLTPRKKKDSTQPIAVPLEKQQVTEPLMAMEEAPVEETISGVSANQETSEVKTINTTAVSKKENVVIVLTAEEVDDKYLDKKSLAEATSGEKKPSTLRKLLDKAYDLKNNDDAFGDLRQKKNEILALNFKNDKQRSENK